MAEVFNPGFGMFPSGLFLVAIFFCFFAGVGGGCIYS